MAGRTQGTEPVRVTMGLPIQAIHIQRPLRKTARVVRIRTYLARLSAADMCPKDHSQEATEPLHYMSQGNLTTIAVLTTT